MSECVCVCLCFYLCDGAEGGGGGGELFGVMSACVCRQGHRGQLRSSARGGARLRLLRREGAAEGGVTERRLQRLAAER